MTAACGGHYRTEHVGQGFASVAPHGARPAPAPAIALARGDYDIALRFDVPRAQEIEWQLTCPGGTTTGSLGESFDRYRERRLAQLKAERERDRQTAGAVTNLIVGAVAPRTTVTADGPNGHAEATVDPGAAAGTAVANSIDTHVELPPGDVGAGRLGTTVHVNVPSDGACSLTATTDDANVIGGFDVTRVRDLDAEAREREAKLAAERAANEQRAAQAALKVRGELSTQLVALGADAGLRERQRAAEAKARADAAAAKAAAEARAGAEARARAEAELQVHAKAQAKIEAQLRAKAEAEARVREEHRRAELVIETHTREVVIDARMRLRALLIVYGADPDLRARIALRERQAREAREAELRVKMQIEYEAHLKIVEKERIERLRIEAEARASAERARIAHEAELERERQRQAAIQAELERAEHERMQLEARRLQVAMSARTELRAYLVSIGARERPPMPAVLVEVPGSSPFQGAVWVAGHWAWDSRQWQWGWYKGGWVDGSVSFGTTGGADGAVMVDSSVSTSVGTTSTVVVQPPGVGIDVGVGVAPVDTRPVVVDHRTVVQPPPPRHDVPVVRDHREPVVQPPPPRHEAPVVRDHREPKKDSRVRDHR